MKLTFNNSWFSLYAKSMGKVFHITHISRDEDTVNRLFKNHDLVTVSGLPGDEVTSLLAKKFSSVFRSDALGDLSSKERPYSNLYIEADGKYFQVAFVATSIELCNRFCVERPDVALIGTDGSGRHYLASLVNVLFNSKAA